MSVLSISPAQKSDWVNFYALADDEGWRVPQVERQLFEGAWAEYVLALDINGTFGGLVTAVAHERSGWIGNLIIPKPLRGQGYGIKLFQAALAALIDRSLSTCWLTASAAGRPIYEKAGFEVVCQVERWVSFARENSGAEVETGAAAAEKLRACDQTAWAENRYSLLESLAVHGQAFMCDDSVALLQRGADVQMIGPWYSSSGCPRANRRILQSILSVADPNIELVVDLLSTSPLRQLLAAAGFEAAGVTTLMMKGDRQGEDLKMMMSLASLGSFG